MALANMQAQTAAVVANLNQTQQSAKLAGEEMRELSRSVLSYGKALFAVTGGEILKTVIFKTAEILMAQKGLISAAKEREKLASARIESMKIELEAAKASHRYSKEQIRHEEMLIAWREQGLKDIQQELIHREKLIGLVTKYRYTLAGSLFTITEVIRSFRVMLATSHEYNRTLISADSSFSVRFQLLNKILSVQRGLGASTESMADSAEALVAHGNHLTPAFSSNLKLVTQMKEGLGASARSGAELVVVFSRQLQVSAERVANVMAQIAASTGLAADKAAQYALEVGRALRLLGPQGMGKEAAEVSRIVGVMAGRIEAIGGSSQSAVAIFKQMLGGSDQSMLMRQMARTSTGALSTEKGALEGMKRLSEVMGMRLTARENTDAYRIQLEQLSSDLGIGANDIADFRQVMREWRDDMNTTRTAAQAYDEQTRLVGESWKQIKTSLRTLITQVLTPLLYVVNPLIGAFAEMVKWLVETKTLAVVIGVSVLGGTIAATIALKRFAKELWGLAKDNNFLSDSLEEKGLGFLKKGIENLPKIKDALGFTPGPFWSKSRFFTSTVGANTQALGGALGLGATGSMALGGALIAGAGVLGWTVGRAIDRAFPNNLIAKIAFHTGKLVFNSDKQLADSNKWIEANKGGSPYQAARNAARLMARSAMGLGSEDEAKAALKVAQDKSALLWGWTPEMMEASVVNTAQGMAEKMAMRYEFAGLTEKSAAEKEQSRKNLTALEQLDTLNKSYDELRETRKAAMDQKRIQEEQLRRQKEDLHWRSLGPVGTGRIY